MSSISPAVTAVINARREAARQQVDIALLAKSLDVQKQVGDATNQLLQQAAEIQKQLANGHLDVKV